MPDAASLPRPDDVVGYGFRHGSDHIGVVAAPGCRRAAGSTYPYTPYEVAWTNTTAANAVAEAQGIRARWNEQGFDRRRLWVVGTDDTLPAAGMGSVASMIQSGADIKILILDKGQRSPGHDLGSIFMSMPGVLVADHRGTSRRLYRSVIRQTTSMDRRWWCAPTPRVLNRTAFRSRGRRPRPNWPWTAGCSRYTCTTHGTGGPFGKGSIFVATRRQKRIGIQTRHLSRD